MVENKVLLKEEKRTLIRNYLEDLSNRKNHCSEDYGVNAISKATNLSYKEVNNVLVSLLNDGVIIEKTLEYETYIINNSKGKELVKRLDSEKKIKYWYDVITVLSMTGLICVLLFTALLIFQKDWFLKNLANVDLIFLIMI